MGHNNGNQNELLKQDELNRRFWKAFYDNNVTELQDLINQSTDVNIKIRNTPILLNAICYGCTNIVNILLAHGADVTVRNYYNQTAFLIALFKGHYRTANVLRHAEETLKEAKKQNNANQQISAADQDGIALLFEAARTGHREFFAAACWYSSGDIIKHKNREGQNTFMIAAIKGHTNIGSLILSRFYYFNINEQDNKGRTALMLAMISKNREFAKLLFNRLKMDLL